MNAAIVRYGTLGAVGQFEQTNGLCFNRGDRVVCRTPRGIEVGEVMNLCEAGGAGDGQILRRLSREDRLLLERLERHRLHAINACSLRLEQAGFGTVLLDAELTFDGGQLFFYFLGDPPAELDNWTQELAQLYQAKIHYRRFSETLANGCGPDCGTKDGGCGTGGCATCAASGSCVKR